MSIKFDSRNPVVEIDKNISIQWNISRADRGSIKFIAIYINEIRDKKKQIVASENSRLFKTGYAKDKYGDRLKTDFIDNQITLNIANAEYEDSGNYLLEIQLKTKEDTNSAVTLKVHGNFIQLLLVIIVLWNFSERQSTGKTKAGRAVSENVTVIDSFLTWGYFSKCNIMQLGKLRNYYCISNVLISF